MGICEPTFWNPPHRPSALRERPLDVARLIAVCLATVACGQQPAAPSIDALLRSGEVEAAGSTILQQLQDPAATDLARRAMAVESIGRLAALSLRLDSDSRERLWRELDRIWNACQDSGVSRDIPVAAQYWFSRIVRGATLLTQARVGPQRLEQQKALDARDILREATRQLKSIDRGITRRLSTNRGPGQAGTRAPLSNAELLALRDHVTAHRAHGWLELSEYYAPRSTDRQHCLRQTLQLLDPHLRRSETTSLDWSIRRDATRCHLSMQDAQQAEAQIEATLSLQPPDRVRRAIQVQQLQLATQKNDSAFAQRLLHELWDDPLALNEQAVTPILNACLQNLSPESAKLTADAWGPLQAWLERLARSAGPLANLRVDLRLSHVLLDPRPEIPIDIARRVADAHRRRESWDAAIIWFDHASRTAGASDAADIALACARQAATMAHRASDWQQAFERWISVCRRWPDDERAEEAHWAAIVCLAQHVRQTNGDRNAYRALLQEHVARWPRQAFADRATWYLAQLWWAEGRPKEAIVALCKMPDESELAVDALRLMGNILGAQAPDARNDKWFLDALAWLQRSALVEPDVGAGLWPTRRVEALLLWCDLRPGAANRRAEMIQEALGNVRDADLHDRLEATLLYEGLLAGDARATQRQLEKLAGGEPARLLATATRVDALLEREEVVRELGVEALKKLVARVPDDLSDEYAYLRGRLALYQGHATRAATVFRQLAKADPARIVYRQRLAEALVASPSPQDVEQGLAEFRQLLAQHEPASAAWFHAKFGVAQAHFQLGDRERARQVIDVTRVVHPDLGGQYLRQKFLKLREDCEQHETQRRGAGR